MTGIYSSLPPTAVLAILLAAAAAADPGVVANPPLVLRIEREGVFRTPSGDIRVPAGAELDVCADGGRTLSYRPDARTVVIPAPCVGLFSDGFE